VRIAVTGSIATDHLMVFPGSFAQQFLPGQMERVALSFLVTSLEVRRGGVAANIAYGLGRLGLRPALVAAAGTDFADYRSWLDRHGVDTESVHVSHAHHTARFVCTTDNENNQIASFYAGAMSEARHIELQPTAERLGGLDLVLIGANDPEAMRRHTDECRTRGYAFAADPSQQLATLDGDEIRQLIDGAAYLFTNEYERALTETKSGWTSDDILQRVGVRVTTYGPDGCIIERLGQEPITVAAAPEAVMVEPTGVGDGFRSGFLAGLAWELDLERAAQVGSLLATLVLETTGPQEYDVEPETFLKRLADAYGDDAAADVRPHLFAS
jgi:adenosine kinase